MDIAYVLLKRSEMCMVWFLRMELSIQTMEVIPDKFCYFLVFTLFNFIFFSSPQILPQKENIFPQYLSQKNGRIFTSVKDCQPADIIAIDILLLNTSKGTSCQKTHQVWAKRGMQSQNISKYSPKVWFWDFTSFGILNTI